ncbi:hypothetical protein NLM33_14060 [Bradyrhizobium sp. CCGUVB1N3]|uniref:hypothetical protein n=1 Tax=Bradyrhizobium sp. CCGUVB1N3 TaxID=2949629 RepID=UPI0020B28C1F|nr:hypothetical protein [Bradyrhizobium sp. CCGUVB1N3]MCP3471455.1 hypothetical protein [Bradyrhizobium sp. CCGUVB1N3]
MPPLTRRRSKVDAHHEMWLIYFGDVRGGWIARRSGVPNSAPQWGWSCGFYTGTDPGEHRSGIAETFEEARADFQAAWQELAATRTHGGGFQGLAPPARLDSMERPDARRRRHTARRGRLINREAVN